MMGAALAGAATLGSAALVNAEDAKKYEKPEGFKGEIKQSVCKWCYGGIPLDEFCETVKSMGLVGVDLIVLGNNLTVKRARLNDYRFVAPVAFVVFYAVKDARGSEAGRFAAVRRAKSAPNANRAGAS